MRKRSISSKMISTIFGIIVLVSPSLIYAQNIIDTQHQNPGLIHAAQMGVSNTNASLEITGILETQEFILETHAPKTAKDTYILLDLSGSMSTALPPRGTRLDWAKNAVITILNNPELTGNVAIITYNGGCDAVRWLRQLTPIETLREDAELKTTIRNFTAGGCTPLTEAFLFAFEDIILHHGEDIIQFFWELNTSSAEGESTNTRDNPEGSRKSLKKQFIPAHIINISDGVATCEDPSGLYDFWQDRVKQFFSETSLSLADFYVQQTEEVQQMQPMAAIEHDSDEALLDLSNNMAALLEDIGSVGLDTNIVSSEPLVVRQHEDITCDFYPYHEREETIANHTVVIHTQNDPPKNIKLEDFDWEYFFDNWKSIYNNGRSIPESIHEGLRSFILEDQEFINKYAKDYSDDACDVYTEITSVAIVTFYTMEFLKLEHSQSALENLVAGMHQMGVNHPSPSQRNLIVKSLITRCFMQTESDMLLKIIAALSDINLICASTAFHHLLDHPDVRVSERASEALEQLKLRWGDFEVLPYSACLDCVFPEYIPNEYRNTLKPKTSPYPPAPSPGQSNPIIEGFPFPRDLLPPPPRSPSTGKQNYPFQRHTTSPLQESSS